MKKIQLNEILKKLIQSLKNYEIFKFEIIIVDDFSNDGTKEILKNLINNEKFTNLFS